MKNKSYSKTGMFVLWFVTGLSLFNLHNLEYNLRMRIKHQLHLKQIYFKKYRSYSKRISFCRQIIMNTCRQRLTTKREVKIRDTWKWLRNLKAIETRNIEKGVTIFDKLVILLK
jgi:hypothetical protein